MAIIAKNYLLSFLSTFVLFYLSFAKPASFNEVNVIHLTDKAAHYIVYVIYGIVLIFEFYKQNKTSFFHYKFLAYTFLFPILLGGVIEIVQETFFKPRSAEWIDWFADIAGITTAWIIMKIVINHTKMLSKHL